MRPELTRRSFWRLQFPLSAMLGISRYGHGSLFAVLNDSSLPRNWQAVQKENNQDGRQTSVPLLNGEIGGTTRMRAGVWERWRFLNAGAFFFLDVTLEPHQRRSGAGCELRTLAIDGIYISPMPRKTSRVVLPPAGRVDVAVRCAVGRYRLASGAMPGASGVFSSDLIKAPTIATVVAMDASIPFGMTYPTTLASFVPARPAYLRDLRDEASPARVVGAGHTLQNTFNFTFQDVSLVDDASSRAAKLIYPFNGDESGTCTFNNKTFAAGTPLLQVGLGTVNTWSCAGVQGHPLHMHVNPMQGTCCPSNAGNPCCSIC
jgi:FtsP/CotA-like multicopper oxidase with cupredoxin domain